MAGSLLKVEGLVKRFGGLTATDHCRLEVAPGELHALIGPNGAGKTTLIGQIAGALRPDAGRIVFDGHDVTHVPAHTRAARGLARTFQITSVFKRYSVLDNLQLAVQARSGSSFRFWRPVREERRLFEEAEAIAQRVGLGERLETPAGRLAHGEQRQLEVALALASRPRLLLLDEPMAGTGPDESARMVEFIADVNREVTILLVEHDMDAVFRLAHRISVLVDGRVIATGEPEAIRNDAEVQKAYLGDEVAG